VALGDGEVDAVDHRERAEALANRRRFDQRCAPVRQGYELYGLSLPATGMFGSAEFSQKMNSSGHLVPFTHWPPGMGVATTLGTGPLPHWSLPIGVSTESVFIVSATFCLSFGLPLALSTAAATSNRAMLGPICWFHCLPLALS